MMRTLVVFLCILLSGCRSEEFGLEWALSQAGDHRIELEKVLAHYQQDPADSLKYRAAVYLICNMPEHRSVSQDLVQSFCDGADSIMALPLDSSLLELSKTDPKLADRRDWDMFRIPALEKISQNYRLTKESLTEDIRTLTADYLIRNIDDAFRTWEDAPWAAHLTFDEFCEYLLPYKADEYYLADNWRQECRRLADSIRDLSDLQYCMYYRNSPHWAAKILQDGLKDSLKLTDWDDSYRGFPTLRISSLLRQHVGPCNERSVVCKAIMMSKGLPVAIDYTPQWASLAGGEHFWCALLSNNHGFYENFGALDEDPGAVHRAVDMIPTKVYRRCYSINRSLYRLNHSGEDVPRTLQNIFMKDVTDEYSSTDTIRVMIDKRLKRKNRFAYLAVFNNRTWVPVAYGEVSACGAIFERMGRNMVYLPVYYSDDRNYPMDYPFTLDAAGRVTHCIPDTAELRTVTLHRKYGPHSHVYNTTRRLTGGYIDACNKSDGTDLVLIYTFKGWNDPAGEIHMSHDTAKYRIWRFVSPPEHYVQMAEIMFYPKGDTIPNRGKIIGTPGTRIGEMQNQKEAMFDGDPFTFFDAPHPSGCWAGIDFGEPVSLDRIVYVYRSDDNNIRMGDLYELFYWKDEQGWTSLGQQQARDIKLTYNNVPSHAVYLLRDLSRGKEEQVFTLDGDGQQVWW